MQLQHIYRKANECVDALVEWRTHQQKLLSVYGNCPSFVYLYYVRDLIGLRVNRLCARVSDVVEV